MSVFKYFTPYVYYYTDSHANIINIPSPFTSMKIHDMPEQNRPRERFLKHGPEALSDAELFAILLRTGSKGLVLRGEFKWHFNQFQNKLHSYAGQNTI